MRSENTCGCGLHRSPEMALTASTNSDPRSYNTLLTSPTAWFSLIPGFIARYNSSYAASTIAAEWFSSEISSCVLRSEEHTSELQSRGHLVCRLLLEKKIVILSFHLLR